MTFRILAACFASLCIFNACSGGSGSGTPATPATPSHSSNQPLLYSLGAATAESTSTSTPPAGTLGLQSLDLTFTYAGQSNAVLVYEVGYTGKFTIASSCTAGPTVAARTRFAATATPTASATATAKPSATATATATAKPSATATASASPVATPTATASGAVSATATFTGSTPGAGPGSVLTVTAGSTGGTCQFTVTDSSNNTSVLFVGNTLTTGSVS